MMEAATRPEVDTVIDAHAHLWDWQLDVYDWMDDTKAGIRRPIRVDELTSELERTGVAGAVLVQTCASVRETREYLALTAEHPRILGVVGWVELTDPDVASVVAELREGPGGDALVGLRHQVHDEPDPNWLDRDNVRRGIEAIGAAGLAYDLLIRPRELPAALRLVRDLVEQRFVLDHIAKPPIAERGWQPWAEQLTELGTAHHVSCKLSGMVTEADWASWDIDAVRPYADHVLAAFGPDRLLFGGDWPVCTLAADYGQVLGLAATLTAEYGQNERNRIFSGTAAEIYGLSLPRR